MTARLTMQEIKEQFRMERHREFLATALRIVTTEGLSALTMTRLADEVGYAVGTLYRHFPSKDALIAEVQREALDILTTSFRLSQTHLDELLTSRQVDDEALAALTRVVTGARFWISAESTFPQEIDLSRRLFTDPTLRMDEEDATRVLPAALRLLDLARQLFDDAAAAGAVRPGSSVSRAVILVAGTTGVLMTSGLDRWDAELFDGGGLATLMVHDLFLGWGADEVRLAAVDDLVAELAAHDHLVPKIRR